MEFDVILEPCEEGGFTAYCPLLKSCISEGDTKEEALENIKEAIMLYLEAIKKEEENLLNNNKEYKIYGVAINA